MQQYFTCFVIHVNESYDTHDVGHRELEQALHGNWYIIIFNLMKALWNKGLSKIPQEIFHRIYVWYINITMYYNEVDAHSTLTKVPKGP